MKKSEKLFLAINDIKDEIIENAKPEEEKPVVLKPAPRSPIKGIILLAACIAVLAVGIFAIVKFKTGGDIDPVSNNSASSSEDSENSGDSDSSDSSIFPDPDVDLTFTEEDLELQEILKDLVANAEEIDRMFNSMSIMEKEPDIEVDQNPYGYHLITDDVKTEPNGLHSVPQTCEEMEKLIRRYFSSRAAESYIEKIGEGTIVRNSDGTSELKIDYIDRDIFVEAEGKMYRYGWGRDLTGTNLGIDVKTAKVISKTDRSIEFSYWGYDYAFDYNDDDDGDIYAERRGALVNEDGVWKIHYYYYKGFCPQIPAEYTDQDLELQKILETLKPGDDAARLLALSSFGSTGDPYYFKINGSSNINVYSDTSTDQSDIRYPKSCDDLRQWLMEYFTEESAEVYMHNVCKGTMTANDDGTYSVTTDKDLDWPTFIEIDGKMFYWTSAASGSPVPYYNSAKVIDQSDDTIIYEIAFHGMGYFERFPQMLQYERGGWKRNAFYGIDSGNNGLQSEIADLITRATDIDGIFTRLSDQDDKYPLMVNGTEHGWGFYPVAENRRTEPMGLFTVPQTRSELEELLLNCFTSRAVEYYMDDVGIGKMITDADGKSVLNDTDPTPWQTFLEVNGKLFREIGKNEYIPKLDIDCATIKLISRTDNTIKFSYAGKIDTSTKTDGVLVFENGRWKLDFFHGYFIPELPTEFTDADLELQDILADLAPGSELITNWIGFGGDTPYYNFYINGDKYDTEYSLLPIGKTPDGKIEYPQTLEELEALMLQYLTQECVDANMKDACKGTMTENPDGTYSVSVPEDGVKFHNFIEIDGRLYVMCQSRGGGYSPFWRSAKIIETTESYIRFSCTCAQMGYYSSDEGLIRYERGGWRLSYSWRGFILD